MSFARKLGIGRFVYRWLHKPIADWKTDESRMARAAAGLTAPPLPFDGANWPVCRYLTGDRFWYQSAFCARSLEIACGSLLRFEFFDDGSLKPAQVRRLRTLFPHSRVVTAAESTAELDRLLPRTRFPLLRQARDDYPLMRKLLDLHAGPGARLCLDSDMLFFAPATELRDWFEKPQDRWFMLDVIESYILPRTELESLASKPLASNVNTGVVAQEDGSIDWEFLEWLVSRLAPELRRHRLLEQTLTAAHFGRVVASPLPADSYFVLIQAFDTPPTAALLHYCWNSNPVYRKSEWRRFRDGPYATALRHVIAAA